MGGMQANSVLNFATKPLMTDNTPSASELSVEPVNNELNAVLHSSAGPESGKPGDDAETGHEELQTMVKKVSKL